MLQQTTEYRLKNVATLDATIEPILRAGRSPGAAIAVVAHGRNLCARGYGCRDLHGRLPMSASTAYPIASTSKALNATLLGILVDEGKLAWDEPVQTYLPRFRLGESQFSAAVTVRDLITMRTGLPRHDWLWIGNPLSRRDLVERLRFLALSAGFRERFQYNNLTTTVAGHIAEVVTGQRWEELVRSKLFEPLGMSSTATQLPLTQEMTVSYHENSHRELLPTVPLDSEVTAPSGGAIYSTVEDMSRWLLFNLGDGRVGTRRLLEARTLKEIQAPQVLVGTDPSAPAPGALYAMGWFLDVYNGHSRISHGGYLHDVNSEVSLFPKASVGIVSFTNFGPPRLARLLNEHAFDLIMGLEPVQSLEDKLSEYERKIEKTQERIASIRRVLNTTPSHSLQDYAGTYVHPGYCAMEILVDRAGMRLRRNSLVLPLEHWHYDAWVVGENDLFPIHEPYAFDRASPICFKTNAAGEIDTLSMRLEPAVAPIRFVKQPVSK